MALQAADHLEGLLEGLFFEFGKIRRVDVVVRGLLLLKHPQLKDAAVIRNSDEQESLSYPKAFVVLAAGQSLTMELVGELQEMVRKEIGGYKVHYQYDDHNRIGDLLPRRFTRTP